MNPDLLFWIFSILLFLLALAFLLPPLLRKPTDIIDDRRAQNISITKSQLAELEVEFKEGGLEKETYQQAKEELEEALYSDLDDAEDSSNAASNQLHSKATVLIVALFVPLLATGLYLKLGKPEAILESSAARAGTPATAAAKKAQSKKSKLSMVQMVDKLAKRLQKEPNDFTGWSMLGRSYMIINKPSDAVKAYEQALSLKQDPSVMLQMADALATSKEGNLQGKPEEYITKALEIEPDNLMGLWLAGMSARQRGAKTEAIAFWEKVLSKLTAGSDEEKEVLQLIAEAKGVSAATLAGSSVAKNSTSSASADKPNNQVATKSITVSIDIADELKSKASPEQTVFIYAKAVTGPPMPLAAVRKQVKDLPIQLSLDDSMAMMPQLKLSGFDQVTVGARISVSGTPTKSAGDLFVEKSPVTLGEKVDLIINAIVK